MQVFDIAVVGAGLAGLTAARDLARRGWSVALIDRKRDLARGVHTTGIFVRKTLESFALPAGTLGPALSRVRLVSPAGREIVLDSEHDEFSVGRMGLLYTALLDQARSAGVRWLAGTRCLGLEMSDDRQMLILESRNRSERLACRFVIAADGARSRLGPAMGLHTNAALLVGAETVYPGQGIEPQLVCYLDPELAPGYLAWVACDGEEIHVGVAGRKRPGYAPKPALDRFTARVAERFALDPRPVRERRGGLIPVGGIGHDLACRAGLLIGDATGAVSPLTAGGLDPCLRLTGFAVNVADSWLGSGDETVLRAYSGSRFRKRFARRLLLRKIMDRLTHPLACELAFALVRSPLLRPLAHEIFFRRGSFPEPPVCPVPASRAEI